jgi:hypothetical protein
MQISRFWASWSPYAFDRPGVSAASVAARTSASVSSTGSTVVSGTTASSSSSTREERVLLTAHIPCLITWRLAGDRRHVLAVSLPEFRRLDAGGPCAKRWRP